MTRARRRDLFSSQPLSESESLRGSGREVLVDVGGRGAGVMALLFAIVWLLERYYLGLWR